uniref:Uncharacterized protein n=1 Tax=Guillardia theta TaxID=55529 RepID=A0A7S4NX88_GUITH|mmetsp:Transcript_37809/g.119464  ORF Transcript_37809/g.119464 Transcript_37809/m.119464 type:complete len:496 (+) Transcript_37809:74-1561(+)
MSLPADTLPHAKLAACEGDPVTADEEANRALRYQAKERGSMEEGPSATDGYAHEVDTLLRKEKLYPDICFMIAKGRHAFRSYRIDGEAMEQMKRSQDRYSQDSVHKLFNRTLPSSANLYTKMAYGFTGLSRKPFKKAHEKAGSETVSERPPRKQNKKSKSMTRAAAETPGNQSRDVVRPRRKREQLSKKMVRRLDRTRPTAVSEKKFDMEGTRDIPSGHGSRYGKLLSSNPKQPSGDEVVTSWKEINRKSLSPIMQVKISSTSSQLDESQRIELADRIQYEPSQGQVALPSPSSSSFAGEQPQLGDNPGVPGLNMGRLSVFIEHCTAYRAMDATSLRGSRHKYYNLALSIMFDMEKITMDPRPFVELNPGKGYLVYLAARRGGRQWMLSDELAMEMSSVNKYPRFGSMEVWAFLPQEGSPVCLFSKLKERRFPSVDEVLSRLADALQTPLSSLSSSAKYVKRKEHKQRCLVCDQGTVEAGRCSWCSSFSRVSVSR